MRRRFSSWSRRWAEPLGTDDSDQDRDDMASNRAVNTETAGPSPSEARVVELTVSLESMPHLIDHCFYRQPPGSETEQLFPVVPMTAMVEIMANYALAERPGLVVVGLADIRALRWLPASPTTEVRVLITPVGERTIKVSIEGYARCTVELADDYAAAPAPSLALEDSGPSPVHANDLYDHRWMFHGPRYQGVTDISSFGTDGLAETIRYLSDQGVTDISSFGTDGLAGTIRYLPDQGAVLDNAGQLMGLWAMQELPVNVLAFPSSIRSMRFYGPQPHTDVDCTVRISGIADRSVTADMELVANGTVWCAISDWEDRRFDTDDVLWPFLRFPEVRTVAQRQPGGWWLVMERWTDSASRELLARRFASLSERADYESRNPLEQRNWLLGRAALKDAVRQHRWALGDDSMFPSEVVIGHDEAGAPYISAPESARGLHVSVSHSGRLGVAHIGTDGPVGIDIERVQARGGRFATLTLTTPNGPCWTAWTSRPSICTSPLCGRRKRRRPRHIARALAVGPNIGRSRLSNRTACASSIPGWISPYWICLVPAPR